MDFLTNLILILNTTVNFILICIRSVLCTDNNEPSHTMKIKLQALKVFNIWAHTYMHMHTLLGTLKRHVLRPLLSHLRAPTRSLVGHTFSEEVGNNLPALVTLKVKGPDIYLPPLTEKP